MGMELERVESLGCQSLASVSSFTYSRILISTFIVSNLECFVSDQCLLLVRPRVGQAVATPIGEELKGLCCRGGEESRLGDSAQGFSGAVC